MNSKLVVYGLGGFALALVALLNFSVMQSELPVPGQFELKHLEALLEIALDEAWAGSQTEALDTAKEHAQKILNLIEGKHGPHFASDENLANPDEYGIVTYAIDLMLAVQQPEAIKMLDSYAARTESNLDHNKLMSLINEMMTEISIAQGAALLVMATRSEERAKQQFAVIENSLRTALGRDVRWRASLNEGVLYLQRVLGEASDSVQ